MHAPIRDVHASIRDETTNTDEWFRIKVGDWVTSVWLSDEQVTYCAQRGRSERALRKRLAGAEPPARDSISACSRVTTQLIRAAIKRSSPGAKCIRVAANGAASS